MTKILKEIKSYNEALDRLNSLYKEGLAKIAEVVIPTSAEFILSMGTDPAFLCKFPAKPGLKNCWEQVISEVIIEYSSEYFGLSSLPTEEEILHQLEIIRSQGLPVIVDENKVKELIDSFVDVQWDCKDIADCSRATAMYISGLNPSSKNPDIIRLIDDNLDDEVIFQINFYTKEYCENDMLIEKFMYDNHIPYKVICEKDSPYTCEFQAQKIITGLKRNNITVKSYVASIGNDQITIKNDSSFEVKRNLEYCQEILNKKKILDDIVNKKVPVFYNNYHKVFFDTPCIEVPKNWAGFCIGKGGCNVQKLSSIFGSKIKIIVTDDIINNNNVKFSLKYFSL
ncbi:MAG: KH domain-containing protein [Syntrophorhabdaceae bacterium]